MARLFNRVLGLGERVRVLGVEWDADTLQVQVALSRRYAPRCGGCGQVVREVHDHRLARYRHLDLCRTRVELRCRLARLRCPRCGVRTQAVPFARARARFTRAFEDLCAWLAKSAPASVVSRYLRVSWPSVGRIAARVVGEARACRDGLDGLVRIGIDEVCWAEPNRYLTVVMCHDSGRVVWVGHGDRRLALERFFDRLGPERSARIVAVSADLGPIYLGVVARRAPQAAICADPFHVMRTALFALDRMRAVQWQRLRGEQPGRAHWMKGTRFALRRGPARRSERDRAIIDELAEVNHELYRAHLWCDQLRASLQEPDPEAASCELAALAEAAPTLGHHLFTRLGGSLSRFRQLIINTVHHRITNGRLEGANSTITLLVHRARGFRRVENLEALIHLVLGRVDVALPT